MYYNKENYHYGDYHQMTSNFNFANFPHPPQRRQSPPCPIKTGHWSHKQNAKYYAFLMKFREKFSEKESRRHWKVFKSLAEFIKTRDPNQCRSHHHKMKKNYGSLEETLEFLRRKQPGIQQKSEKYLDELQNFDFNDFVKGPNDAPEINNPLPQNPEENLEWDLEPLPEMDYNFGNQIGCLQGDKLNGIAFKKTNDGYQQIQKFPMEKHQEFLPNFNYSPDEFIPSYGGFPSTGLLKVSNIQAEFQVPNNDNQFQSVFECERVPRTQQRKNKILECQYYFQKWITSVEQLMKEQDEQV